MSGVMDFPIPPRQPFDPPLDCARCARLVDFRETARHQCPGGFNGAVPSFGDPNAWLLIVGLAPGMQGANRTGRPFTGDYAGDLLYETLAWANLSKGTYRKDPVDGLTLNGVMITNAVHCLPPQNKPSLAEVKTCQDYLRDCFTALPQLQVILCLGKIAHDATLRALGIPLSKATFAHAATHIVGDATLIDSYHCSRYNTNTGRLTTDMFRNVFTKAIHLKEK